MFSSARRSPSCTGGGLLFKSRRPSGVSAMRIPRRSSVSAERRAAPRSSRRSTIPETVEGCAKSLSDSSPRDRPGSRFKTVRAHTCGPDRPVFFSMAFEYSWIALNRRRRLLTTSAASSGRKRPEARRFIRANVSSPRALGRSGRRRFAAPQLDRAYARYRSRTSTTSPARPFAVISRRARIRCPKTRSRLRASGSSQAILPAVVWTSAVSSSPRGGHEPSITARV